MTENQPTKLWTDSLQSGAPSQPMLPVEHVMDNGLRIITLSTPGYKTGRVNVRFNAGSSHDPHEEEGIAHFLEHMMLKGSLLNRDEHKRDDQLNQWGGDLNAETSELYTSYYTQEPVIAQHLEGAVDMVLDMVQHPRLRPEVVPKERGVIKAELAEGLNDLSDRATLHFMQTSFPGSPMVTNILGSNETLDHIDEKRLRAFWNKHYVPQNTTISVQGPYPHEELLAMVKKHLTILGAKDTQEQAAPLKWPDLEPKTACMPVRGVKGVECNIGWPGLRNPLKPTDKEPYILDLMERMLHKILHRELRDKGMIYGVTFDASTDSRPTVLELSTDKSPERVIKKVMKVLSQLPDLITQDTLDQLRNELKVETIKESDNPLEIALHKMHMLEKGKLVYSDESAEKIFDSVTLKEVHEMAARLFSKPCSCSIAGEKKLIEKLPEGYDVSTMYKGPRNDGPLQGWAEPVTEAAYNPRASARIAKSYGNQRFYTKKREIIA